MATHLNNSSRRGAVTLEFVICMPIFGAMIALTFFFGWSLVHQQNVKMASRNSAWRAVRGPMDPTAMEINRNYFTDKGSDVVLALTGGPGTVYNDYLDSVGPVGLPIAQDLTTKYSGRVGRAYVSSAFPTSVGLWQKFEGSIHSELSRESLEWRRNDADNNDIIRDRYLSDLDKTLESIPAPGNGMGVVMRSLYLAHW